MFVSSAVTIDTFREFCDNIANIPEPWLREEHMDVGGGIISIADIDRIKEFSQADVVTISGLNQVTFEYFIKTYGHQFKAIRFFKNKLVSDWSLLGELPQLEFVYWFFNQRISSFWDLCKNTSLIAIAIEDFCKLKSLERIHTAPALEWLSIGDAVWQTTVIDGYKPLKNTRLKRIDFYGGKVLDTDFSFVLDMPSLKELNFSPKLLTTEQVAWIVANRPDLQGWCLGPAEIVMGNRTEADEKFVEVTGKGKRGFSLKGNEKRLKKIEEDFQRFVERYRGASYPL